MTLVQLRYAIEIAEAGSISAAAARLFVAQPSLSKAISELEHEMGIQIFERSRRGVEVTEEGTFGAETRGRRQACYHVRFGGHETELYLERRSAVPAMGLPEELRWWVFAYDQTLSRATGK